MLPVACQRVRRRASGRSLRRSPELGVGKSAGATRMPWLPKDDAGESHMFLRIGLVICTFLRSKVCFCAVRAVVCPMDA